MLTPAVHQLPSWSSVSEGATRRLPTSAGAVRPCRTTISQIDEDTTATRQHEEDGGDGQAHPGMVGDDRVDDQQVDQSHHWREVLEQRVSGISCTSGPRCAPPPRKTKSSQNRKTPRERAMSRAEAPTATPTKTILGSWAVPERRRPSGPIRVQLMLRAHTTERGGLTGSTSTTNW